MGEREQEVLAKMTEHVANHHCTETIDKLYLELSQVTQAKTERDIALEGRIRELERLLRECLEDQDILEPHWGSDEWWETCAALANPQDENKNSNDPGGTGE